MHDCVSGFVSQHIKSIILSKQVCKREGKEEREQKDIILLTSMSLLVCVFVLLPAIVYCRPVPQKAELFWALMPGEQWGMVLYKTDMGKNTKDTYVIIIQ